MLKLFLSNYRSPIRKSHPLLKIINGLVYDLPAPINLNIWWNFGSLLGLCLIIQILTGLFLAIHYTPHIDLAFSSVAHIIRDVNRGWLLRSLHCNGASIFFFLYLCTYRSRIILWILFFVGNLNLRCYFIAYNNSYCFYGLRITLGSNKFLRCYSNY